MWGVPGGWRGCRGGRLFLDNLEFRNPLKLACLQTEGNLEGGVPRLCLALEALTSKLCTTVAMEASGSTDMQQDASDESSCASPEQLPLCLKVLAMLGWKRRRHHVQGVALSYKPATLHVESLGIRCPSDVDHHSCTDANGQERPTPPNPSATTAQQSFLEALCT